MLHQSEKLRGNNSPLLSDRVGRDPRFSSRRSCPLNQKATLLVRRRESSGGGSHGLPKENAQQLRCPHASEVLVHWALLSPQHSTRSWQAGEEAKGGQEPWGSFSEMLKEAKKDEIGSAFIQQLLAEHILMCQALGMQK